MAHPQMERETRWSETHRREIEKAEKGIAGASGFEGVAALGGIVLSILALANVAAVSLTAIAAIVLGAGFLFEGGGISAGYSRLLDGRGETNLVVGGGSTAQAFGGLAAIALGILSLVGVAPGVLLPVSALVLGGTLMASAGTLYDLQSLLANIEPTDEGPRQVAKQALRGSAGMQILAGVAAATLGILVLTGATVAALGMILVPVAILTVAVAMGLESGVVTGRIGRVLFRKPA